MSSLLLYISHTNLVGLVSMVISCCVTSKLTSQPCNSVVTSDKVDLWLSSAVSSNLIIKLIIIIIVGDLAFLIIYQWTASVIWKRNIFITKPNNLPWYFERMSDMPGASERHMRPRG